MDLHVDGSVWHGPAMDLNVGDIISISQGRLIKRYEVVEEYNKSSIRCFRLKEVS